MKKIIFLMLLMLVPVVSAFQTNSSSYVVTGSFVSGMENYSSDSFRGQGVLGNSFSGRVNSTSFVVIPGVLGGLAYDVISGGAPSSAAGGGAGCALGFYKNQFGECINETSEEIISFSKVKEIKPFSPLVILGVFGVLMFIFAFKRSRKKKKKLEEENETFK